MRFLAVLAIVFGASAAYADLSYTFDSDNQGWRRGDLDIGQVVMTDLGAATWNPAGYIDADDFSSWAFHLSPTLNMDLSSSTRIEFDYSSTASDNVYPFLIIASNTAAIFQMSSVPADGMFHHYSYDFTPGTWFYHDSGADRMATAADIASVMGMVQAFGINADQQSGLDYTQVDNVALVPEPASFLALAIGVCAFAKRRRSHQ